MQFYLHDHLDGGQGGGDVLRVRRTHRDRHAAGIKAAVKRHDEVDTCRKERKEDNIKEGRETENKQVDGGRYRRKYSP